MSAYQTQMYLYNQRQYVVLLSTAGSVATRRYSIVYAKQLRLNRGVDNVLEFAFINQDQKPVNLSGKYLYFRVINNNGTELILTKQMTPNLPVTGIYNLELSIEEVNQISPSYCYYTVEVTNTPWVNTATSGSAAITNASGIARGDLIISESIFPAVVPSLDVTIPTHPRPTQGNAMQGGNSTQPQPKLYYSSEIKNEDAQVLTIQYRIEEFCGNITIEGSNIADFSRAYNIGNTVVYGNANALPYPTGVTQTVGETITGYHPYVRLAIQNYGSGPPETNQQYLKGDVVKILAR